MLTFRVLSTSPHGRRLLKSMPVRGVPVGGSRIEASCMRYSTFSGLFCIGKYIKSNTLTHFSQISLYRRMWSSWMANWSSVLVHTCTKRIHFIYRLYISMHKQFSLYTDNIALKKRTGYNLIQRLMMTMAGEMSVISAIWSTSQKLIFRWIKYDHIFISPNLLKTI